MCDYILTSESTADYPRAFFEKRHIPFASFHYELDGAAGLDDLYQSVSSEAFFSALKDGGRSTTSQPSAGEYASLWRPHLKQGLDVVHLTLSSGISGAFNSASVAAEQLASEFPERTIHVVDSLAASSGFGLLLEQMADRRDAGMSAADLADWARDHRLEVNHWFFVSDLDCLKRGGRVSAASAVIATALKICPVLDIDHEGHLIPRTKIRTARKAVRELARVFAERVEGGAASVGPCVISHSQCREEAEQLAEMIGAFAPALVGKVAIHDIGTVIGSHTGPGTVALFFMGERRSA